MGRLKEDWIDRIENRSINLASILEISVDELEELDYQIEIDASKDGLIYSYRVEFDEGTSSYILSKIQRLEDGCRVYLEPWELESEQDYNEQFDAVSGNKNFIENYRNEIINLKSLSSIELVDSSLIQTLYRQVFIGVIGSMETFLSDAFINLTLGEEYYFRRFVETHPEFKKRKFEVKDIFDVSDKLKISAKKVMLDMIYHKLPVIKKMYIDTFQVDFPNIEKMHTFVLNRHDLVHRNGKTKDGNCLNLDLNVINELIECSNKLVEEVYSNITEGDVPF